MTPSDQFTPNEALDAASVEALRKIAVLEEDLVIRQEVIETSEVTIRKTVDSEEVELPLRETSRTYDVQRRPVGKTYDEAPAPVRVEDGATIYTVVREIPTVVIRYEVIEEIVVRSTQTDTDYSTMVELRKERVQVDRKDLPDADTP